VTVPRPETLIPAARPRAEDPLVTIGIPAYNRPAGLARAIRSAMAQEHSRIEILVSDDASPDPSVHSVAVALAGEDPRIRVVRQERNLGHAANYQWVLDAAKGEYFMWLADDDWIDPHYVDRCLAVLRQGRYMSLVCGLARYYRGGLHVIDERVTNLSSTRPGKRILDYFSRVNMNGPLFGLARREDLLAVGFPAVPGGDWLLVGAMAARGGVRSLETVHIHRSLDGLGGDGLRLAESFGLRGLRARHHHILVAAQIWREIVAGPPRFVALNPVPRLFVATSAAASVIVRFKLAELGRTALGADTAAQLERRVSRWLRSRKSR
jgi:hypothetical protein